MGNFNAHFTEIQTDFKYGMHSNLQAISLRIKILDFLHKICIIICTSLRLGLIDLSFYINECSMNVFVFLNELFAFLHLFAFEEICELFLNLCYNFFQIFLELKGLLFIGPLNFLLQLEYLKHEFPILNLTVLFQFDSLELHQVDCSLEIIEESCLGFIDVAGVLQHLLLQRA